MTGLQSRLQGLILAAGSTQLWHTQSLLLCFFIAAMKAAERLDASDRQHQSHLTSAFPSMLLNCHSKELLSKLSQLA